MFTKTQAWIMEIFVSKMTERFSIRQIAGIVNRHYPIVYQSIQALIKGRFLTKDEHELLALNYKENHAELSYIESLRKKDFLNKNKEVALFAKDVADSIKHDFFILLVFGSSVKKGQKPRDIDILLVLAEEKDINSAEKLLQNIASRLGSKFDINVISAVSVYEMLSKRDQLNVANETLNNHVILFGAENYYRMLKNAR